MAQPQPHRAARAVGCLFVAVVVVVGLVIGGWQLLRRSGSAAPLPGEARCVATAGDHGVVLDPEQARNAAIIVGLSVKRGLAPRAASIAMATAYQESGVRNISYGDRDSVGLFQQRPSQGWGTARQIMDPYYSTGKFYDALVKIKNWEDGDINDVAQKIQVSGHPEAYRDHVADARTVASTLTGQTHGGFSCLDRAGVAGDAKALQSALTKTFGSVDDRRDGKELIIAAEDSDRAWAYAAHALATASAYGVVQVVVGDQQWRNDEFLLPEWTKAQTPAESGQVVVTVR